MRFVPPLSSAPPACQLRRAEPGNAGLAAHAVPPAACQGRDAGPAPRHGEARGCRKLGGKRRVRHAFEEVQEAAAEGDQAAGEDENVVDALLDAQLGGWHGQALVLVVEYEYALQVVLPVRKRHKLGVKGGVCPAQQGGGVAPGCGDAKRSRGRG